MRLRDWYDLTRLDHGILWGAAVLIGEGLACRGIPPLPYAVIGFLIPVFIEIGIFALNDYIDVESDILNKRSDRPLTRNAIPHTYPLYLSAIVLPMAIIIGVFIQMVPFLIVVVGVVLGVLYNIKLKEVPLVKNAVMGLCIAAPLIGGNLVITNILPIVLVFGAAAFTAGFGREVLKDMMDVKGDKAHGCTTFPILFGLKISSFIVSFLLLLACFFVLLPFFYPLDVFYFHDPVYLVAAAVTSGLVMYCVYTILKDRSYETIKLLRKKTLYVIEVGIITFILGAIV